MFSHMRLDRTPTAEKAPEKAAPAWARGANEMIKIAKIANMANMARVVKVINESGLKTALWTAVNPAPHSPTFIEPV